MIYHFKLVSDEVSNFSRDIEIDSNATFLDLRNAVLESVGYSKDDMNSFYICEKDWSRREEITLEDMGSSSDRDIWIMSETVLSDLLEDEGQKLIFVFDYITERAFFMELKEVIPCQKLAFPKCSDSKGNPPQQQIDVEVFEENLDKEAKKQVERDMDLDFYGDSEYNDDELPEGFDDITMN